MPSSSIHKVRDLTPNLRRAVESLIGRALRENETVTVRASSSIARDAPSGQAREKAYRDLIDHMETIHSKVSDVPPHELDALIEEALAHVRKRR